MPDYDVSAVRRAWRTAAQDLAIRVTTAGASLSDSNGVLHPVLGIVHDFGGKSGMVILLVWDRKIADLAQVEGYGCTVLSSGYEQYRREIFEEALNDWQWTGVGEPPPWYTGEPWTN